MRQKRVPIVLAFIISLALTGYGRHQFLNIGAGNYQASGSKNQQVIQLGLPVNGIAFDEPTWILTSRTAAPDISAQNSANVRIGLDLSELECGVKEKSGQFFIAGIIVEDGSESDELVISPVTDYQFRVFESNYSQAGSSHVAIN